ncbi:MAG: NAD-dependent deacylase [candidate division WOR-3 bacterium]
MNINEMVKEIFSLNSLLVLTGAGVSQESGVPTFRGKDGLWKNYDAKELATPHAFEKNPKLVWEWYNWRRKIILKAKPNSAHYGIKKLEEIIPDFLLVTQNVDDLHREAGSKKIVEIHGNIFRTRCTVCNKKEFDKKVFKDEELPPKCKTCGSLLRPDVVWFGEPIDEIIFSSILEFLLRCDAILVVGTSLLVYPAASIPFYIKEKGGKVFEINLEPTQISGISDISIFGKAGEIFEKFINIIT